MAERDSNSDSSSPVSGLLSPALYNLKGKFTVFQVLHPQFREVRSHTESLSTRAFLTSGYKSSQRKQNNELTEVASGVEDQGAWDIAENSRGMFSSENVPEHLCLSVTQADGEMDSHASSYTNRHRHKRSHAPRGSR